MVTLVKLIAVFIMIGAFILGCNASSPSTPVMTQTSILSIPTGTETLSPTFTTVPFTPTGTTWWTPTPLPVKIIFSDASPIPTLSWRTPLYNPPLALGVHDHFYFSRPIAVNQVNWLLADYRYGYIFPNTDVIHTGIDIEASRGTPILATAPGIVVWAGHDLQKKAGNIDDPYGLAVAIRHDFGYQGNWVTTIYAHMDRIDVKNGQVVKTGEQIGIVGNTGFTTGPHLHFEIRMESKTTYSSRNPELWLVPPIGNGVLVGRVMFTNGQLLDSKSILVESSNKKKWTVYTYGQQTINSDDFFNENFVLGNLPAGKYKITILFDLKVQRFEVEINAGTITYFTFQGKNGFTSGLPSHTPTNSWENFVPNIIKSPD